MRSASYNFRRVVQWALLVVGMIAFATLLGKAQQKINPNTQINWPAGCAVYNVSANACPPVGGITFKGAWSSGTTYAVNDAVFESGSTYVSLQAGNLNHNPLTSPTFWTLLVSGATAGGPNLSLQFNQGGALGGSAAITTDTANQAVSINSLNPTPNFSACGFTPALCVFGLWNAANQASFGADPVGINITPIMAYNAYSWGNPGPGGWSVQKALNIQMLDYSRGITQSAGSVLSKYAVGDTANYFYVFTSGGSTAESDESVCAICGQAVQWGNYYTGTVNGTQATGTQTLASTSLNTNSTFDGAYLVNRTAGAITGGRFVPYVVNTAWTFDGTNTFVFTAANSLVVGQPITEYGFVDDQWINGNGTVTAASGTQYTVVINGLTHASGSATEMGVGRFTGFPVAGTSAVAQQVGGISLTPTVARGTVNLATTAITAWSITGNVATFTASNTLVAGETLVLSNFGTATFFNYNVSQTGVPGTPGLPVVVLSSGLSGSQFKATFIHANGSGTESGTGTLGMPVNGATSPAVFTTVVDVIDTVSSFPTTANLVGCLTGGQPEQVLFTAQAASTGHQLVTITYREPHAVPNIVDAFTTLWYGGPCGMFIDQLQQSTRQGGLPTTYFVVGALDSSHIVYAWNLRGNTANLIIPAFQNPVPYATALRTGTTVSATLFPGFGSSLNGAAAVNVISSTNSAFLGAGTSAAQALNSTGVSSGITFTQSGTNGDTSTALLVSLPASSDAISLYCGAEVVGPSTPSPGSPTVIHLEPNNCPWNSGDSIINPPHPSYNTEGIGLNVDQHTPSNPGLSQGIGMLLQDPGIDAQFRPFFVQYTNPMSEYVNHGGTVQPGPWLRIQGVGPGIPVSSIFSIANSGINGAPVINVEHDEFGTDLTRITLAQVNSGTISYFPPTATWFMNNLDVANLTVHGTPSFPSLFIGTSGLPGTIFFSRDGSTKAANFTLCNPFGTDGFLGLNTGTSGTTCQQGQGGYLANGQLMLADTYSINTANMNSLSVGTGLPINPIQGTYTGTAGSATIQYWQIIMNADGQEGSPILLTGGGSQFMIVSNISTLGGGNTVSLPCPAARQFGMPSTANYVYYSLDAGGFKRVGTCPIGGTLVDSGAGTAAALPLYNANATATIGDIILAPHLGRMEWPCSIYLTTICAGVSQAAGVISFDGATAQDGTAQVNFGSFLGQPATAPSGACTVDGLWVFSQDGHATFCAAGTWTTKI